MLKHRNFLRAWHAKQYDGRPRKNPFFPDRESIPRFKVLVFMIGGGALLVGGISLFIFAPIMSVQAVTIQGLTTIAPSEVEQVVHEQRAKRRWFIAPQNNAYLLDKEAIAMTLEQRFQFESLSVERKGREVIISAKERILEVALQSGGKTFFLGIDGTLVREASPEESRALDVRLGKITLGEGESLPHLQPTMPILIDLSASEHPVLSSDRVHDVLDLNERLLARNITPSTYTFTNFNEPWTRVQSTQSYAILIDITQNLTTQLELLDVILHQTTDPIPYEYIDVRFGDHVYVK